MGKVVMGKEGGRREGVRKGREGGEGGGRKGREGGRGGRGGRKGKRKKGEDRKDVWQITTFLYVQEFAQ